MATFRRIKPPYRAGQRDDPFTAYELKSLYALAMTLNDMSGGYTETRDSEHEYWLRVALGDAIEQRCARMVKVVDDRENRESPKDGA